MSALSIQPTFPTFTDIDGQPLDSGYVFIGTANLNPIGNPINVFFDAALTQPAVQPIRTISGYPSNAGTPARLYVNSDYSIQVQNKNGTLVYSAPTATERYNDVVISSINASKVIYDPAGAGAQQTNAQQKMRQEISVFDFMTAAEITDVESNTAVLDVSAKIRLALDYAGSLATNCQVFFPPGTYYVPTTVFIPRGDSANRSGALNMIGYGAKIRGAGAGTGVIFETGAQTFSTGASSNFGLPEAHLHYGQIIEGFYFENCYTALKLYNWLEGCCVQNCSGYDLVTFIHAERSFYGDFVNNRGGSDLAYNNPGLYSDEDAVFRFADFVNVQNIDGNSVVRGKTGFFFGTGMFGLMSSNNSAEGCRKGLVIKAAVFGALFYGWYLEGNDRDIEVSGGGGKSCLTIDGFWCASADLLYAETWLSGEFGKNILNSGVGSIDATDGLNQFNLWLPRSSDEIGVTEVTTTVVPSNWSLNESIIVHAQDTRYVAVSGPSNVRYGLPENYIGGNNLDVPRYYRGRSNMRYRLPYCSLDVSVFGDATIDTKIPYDQYESGIRFDFTVLDSVADTKMAGWIIGSTVFRNDAAGQTITASDNGGFYRLVIAGFSSASAINVLGGIRIV